MKKMILLLIFPAFSYSQNTIAPIKGFSVFNLGDSINLLESYNYSFRELTIPEDFDYSAKYQDVDSFKNFCNDCRFFYTDELKIEDYEFQEGTILTYYRDHLVDIRVLGFGLSEDKLKDLFILKYGNRYKKIYLLGYYYYKELYKKKGKKITPAQEKYLQDEYLSSIEWEYKGNTFCIGGSNPTYNFTGKYYESANLSSSGIAVSNLKEYAQVILCSNRDYKIKYESFLKKLKNKKDKF